MAKTHEVKIWPKYFDAVVEGRLTFQLRRDDRNYQVGERMLMREWDQGAYTGREVLAEITFKMERTRVPSERDLTTLGLSPTFAILATKLIANTANRSDA